MDHLTNVSPIETLHLGNPADRKEKVEKSPAYDVFMTLAGHSANRRWCKSYRSLSAAKRFCDKWAGYGRVTHVVEKASGKTVYTVINVPA